MSQYCLWIWFLCVQAWSEAAGRDGDWLMVNGILGESATFHLNIQKPQKIKTIAWISKSSVAVVTPGVQGAPPAVTVTQNIYKGRIEAKNQSYDLVIRDLRMEDAGTYKADINEEDSAATTTKSYYLHIYRRLEKPKITQSLATFVNNTCNVTLTCSVGKEEQNVTYIWSPLGEKSNVLQIIQSPEDQKLTYTCTAQNPVSNNSDSVTIQQLCTEAPSYHPHRVVLPSGLAALFLLILIPISVLLLHLYRRRRKIALEDDVSKKTVYASVSRNPHPTEFRIYDEIPEFKVMSCKKEAMHTIYSTVELSETVGKPRTKDDRPPKTLGNEIVV